MNQRRARRSVLWLQGAILFFLVLLFGAGVFFDHMLEKIEAQLAAHPSSEFDRRLATKIGKPFTAEDHGRLVEIVTSKDEDLSDITKASHSLAKAALNVSGVAAFFCLLSIFLIVRNLRGEETSGSGSSEGDD